MRNEKLEMRNAKEQRAKSKEQSKTSFLGLIFSLLIAHCSFLILLSCQNPFTGPETGNTHTQIPAGKGSFSLSVSVADVGRTIFPALKQSDFTKYTIAFTATSGGTSLSVDRIPSTISNPVYLDPGTYSLVVTAYIAANPVAQGKINELVIEEREETTRKITLRVINEIGYTGTFTYDVNFPTGITKAEIKITPLAGTGTPEQTIPLLSGTGGETLTLNTGYYNVVVTLEKTDAQLVWRETLHIYGNLESKFTKNFTNDDFYRTFYTVTFDLNYTGSSSPGGQSVEHGSTVNPQPDPERAGYYFEGWSLEANNMTPFIFGESGTPIISDTTIYAGWTLITLPLTDVKYIKPYLAAQTTKGITADDPVPLSFNLNLGTMTSDTSNWQLMLGELNAVSKFVELDLSVCAMNGTEFNPVSSVATGKDRIVTIALPDVATTIPDGTSTTSAFNNFTVLKSFSGAGLKIIGNRAFFDRASLTQDLLPAGVINIGDSAFMNCANLALESLPAGITNLYSSAFSGCTNLALTSLPENITFINGSTFSGCTKLALESLPAGVTGIFDRAFQGCTSLALTELPEKVTSIGERAFYGCTKLALISLPTGLSTIGDNAFYGCTSLATITFLREDPPTAGSIIFGSGASLSSNLRIEVLSETIAADYREAAGWSTYASRIFAIGADADGSEEKPFIITSADDLQKVGTENWTLDKHYRLVGPITLTKPSPGASNWTPIGTYNGTPFSGTFDGTGNRIENLTIYAPNNDFQGMFGAVTGAVRNLSLIGCEITGKDFVGGVVGGNGGTVENCNVSGSITGTGTTYSDEGFVGGVVGLNQEGIVKKCYATGSVSGGSFVGGVVGSNGAYWNTAGTVENCYASSDVSGSEYVGGVVGDNYDTMENCYATGTISGTNSVGGVVGSNDGTLKNCYAIGDVIGDVNVGGVVGGNYNTNDTEATVENCYGTGGVRGTKNVGGVVGANYRTTDNSGTVKNCVALNKNIYKEDGDVDEIGRVVGSEQFGDGSFSNNYARNPMTMQYDWDGVSGTDKTPNEGLNTVDGVAITATQWHTATWWTGTAQWSTTAWNIANGSLPTLQNMPGNPTQNPVVKP